jgi:hypothetical protein
MALILALFAMMPEIRSGVLRVMLRWKKVEIRSLKISGYD